MADVQDLLGLLAQFQPSDEDKKAALSKSLMAFGFGLLGGKKGDEWGAVGRSGLNSMNEYQQNMALSAGLRQKQLEQAGAMNTFINQQKAAAQAAEDQKNLGNIFSGGSGPQLQNMGPGGPTPENAQAVAPQSANPAAQFRQAAMYYASRDVVKAKHYSDIADKLETEYSTTPQTYKDEAGNVKRQLIGKRGETKDLTGAPALPLHFMNNGIQAYGVDQFTGNIPQNAGIHELSPSPEARLTDARAREFNALKRAELEGSVDPMTPEAIANAAARYNVDGTLPAMGMGKIPSNYRSAILNEAARQAKDVSPEDQRIAQIGNKANTAALAQVRKQESMVGAFEKTFNKNVGLVEEYSNKVDRTGVPIVNKWIQAGKRAIQGDPELSAYDIAIKSVVNEYTKIISGSMGNTVMAEGEIKKVEGMLAAAQNPAQVKEIVGFMKRETQNRMSGFKEQRDELAGSMRAGKSPRQDTVIKFDANGNMLK